MTVVTPPKQALKKQALPPVQKRSAFRSSSAQLLSSPEEIQTVRERLKQIESGNAVWIPATPEFFEDIKRRGRERAKAKNLL